MIGLELSYKSNTQPLLHERSLRGIMIVVLLINYLDNMKALHMIAFILLVVGGLEWGLHAFGYDPVDMLGSQVSMIVYVLVGLSAVFEALTHKKNCSHCAAPKMGGMGGQM